MTSRFPAYPPQRLPRPDVASLTTVGLLNLVSGAGGFTTYEWTTTSPTWRGLQQNIVTPTTVPFVAARMVGAGSTNVADINLMQYGIFVVGANKTILWTLVNNGSLTYSRHAGTTWPPGAFESTYSTASIALQSLGPFIGVWFDRTVSPARARPFFGFDCYKNPVAGGAPLGPLVRGLGVDSATLSGGGADDMGAPQSWGIGYINNGSVIGPRITVTEMSQGAFFGDTTTMPDISGDTGQGGLLVGRGQFTVGRGGFLGGSGSSGWG